VLGDVVYGGPPGVTDAGEDPRLLPIALHASRIAFEDPVTGLPVEVDCPPPTGWIGRFAVPRTPA
jgi:23S rRNA-/tRNA-specific pseudouridylate synthase